MHRKSSVQQDHDVDKTGLILLTFCHFSSAKDSYLSVPRPCGLMLSEGCQVKLSGCKWKSLSPCLQIPSKIHLVKWKEDNGYPGEALLDASFPKKKMDKKLVEVGHVRPE